MKLDVIGNYGVVNRNIRFFHIMRIMEGFTLYFMRVNTGKGESNYIVTYLNVLIY